MKTAASMAAVPLVQGKSTGKANISHEKGYEIHLTDNGRSLVDIVRGSHDEYAANKVAREIRKFATNVSVFDASSGPHLSRPAAIYVGTMESNSALARVAEALKWRSDIAKLQTEGYLIRTGMLNGRTIILLAGGDRTGAIYAASDLKNFYLQRSAHGLSVSSLNYVEVPKMPYRWVWNWDARTNWDLSDHDNVNYPDIVERAKATLSARPYWKRPEAFLTNMEMAVDYMSEHKINGLIVWGFLRDDHGGVETAQELCRYANERGVKIIPGVNLDRSYGGIYHEGNNEFNLATRAAKFPQLRTMDKEGHFVPNTLCVQKPENRDWIRRGIRWLYDTFPIGGVNIEFGEHAACYTPDCVEARKHEPGNEDDFYKDLARIMPWVIQQVHERAPNTWISYATYCGYTPEMQTAPPLYIRLIPPYAITQWTLTLMFDHLVPSGGSPSPAYGPMTFVEGVRPPGVQNIGYVHWNGQERGFLVDAFREAAAAVYRSGFKGLVAYGEDSADLPNMELNYLAFTEFDYNPEMSEEDFLMRRVAPLYGGVAAGRLLLQIARIVGPIRDGIRGIPTHVPSERLDVALKLAYRGAELSSECGKKERWARLIRHLDTVLRR